MSTGAPPATPPATPPADGGRVSELLVALSRARRWLTRLAGDEPALLGSSGVSALAAVARGGPLRLGDLAAREHITPATLSRVVAGLVEHGYVERTPDPDDARAGLLTVTPAGADLLHGLASRRAAELSARLDRLPAGEREALLAAVPALSRLTQEG